MPLLLRICGQLDLGPHGGVNVPYSSTYFKLELGGSHQVSPRPVDHEPHFLALVRWILRLFYFWQSFGVCILGFKLQI